MIKNKVIVLSISIKIQIQNFPAAHIIEKKTYNKTKIEVFD